MSAPAPAPHTEDVQPGRRAHAPLQALRRHQQVVLRRRRAAALGLVAVVAVSGFAVTRGGMPFSGADPASGQVEAPAAAVAIPPPPTADQQGAPVAADQDSGALIPTGPGEPCRAEPGGAEIASGPVGGAAFGASALGCTIPAWQALPPTPLEATDARMLLAQVTREQAVDPVDYEPEDLVPLRGGVYQARAEVGEQLDALFAAAAEAGHPSLTVTSGFRSHETQAGTFADWAGRLGEERADLLSARPGHSEHQLGLAVDLGGNCNYQCFGASPEGQWVAANAHRWGFIVRYPQDGQAVTGYAWEPWHLRYVGPRAAWGMHLAGEAYWEHFQPVAARAAGVH